MISLQLSLPVSGAVPVILSMPLTSQAVRDLDQAVGGSVAALLRDLCDDAVARAPRSSDAGAIEYASWLPDPGAIEIASWMAQIQPAGQ